MGNRKVNETRESLRVWGNTVEIHYRKQGTGPPLLYVHGAGGLRWHSLLDRLATEYTVYAPEFPGTSEEDPYAIRTFDELSDIILAYEEFIDRLDIGGAMAVGEAFGGMLVAELASTFTDLFKRVVLLGPIGLWHDDMPVMNWAALPPEELPSLLFKNPESEEAQEFVQRSEEPEEAAKEAAAHIWALGCTAKFMWPLPDRGLKKRLHRVRAPTLIVWGEDDKFANVGYAEKFRERISNSEAHIVPDAGHLVHIEQPHKVSEAVRSFFRMASNNAQRNTA